MDSNSTVRLEPPRFTRVETLLVAGKAKRYTLDDKAGIPAQWRRFIGHAGTIPGRTGAATYGVCFNGEDDTGSFDYLCGVEVASFDNLGREWDRIRIGDHTFAVFHCAEHISTVGPFIAAVWTAGLPASDYQPVAAPWFERYGPEFDPSTGLGGFEIWIPVKPPVPA